MDKVRVIERSLRCCTAGWLALIPLVGLVPAIVAIRLRYQVRAEVGGEWNPAEAYLKWGWVLGWLGLLLSALLWGGVLVVVINATL